MLAFSIVLTWGKRGNCLVSEPVELDWVLVLVLVLELEEKEGMVPEELAGMG